MITRLCKASGTYFTTYSGKHRDGSRLTIFGMGGTYADSIKDCAKTYTHALNGRM